MLESVPMLSSGITVDVIGSQCRCENDSIWWTDTPIPLRQGVSSLNQACL